MDEDELESELEGLQQEQLDERMMGAGKVPVGDKIDRTTHRLPTAPDELDEEEELKKLQAEMAM